MLSISSKTTPQHKVTKTAGPSSGRRKTIEKKASCRRTGLQTLPAELKNQIYEYVLFTSGHQHANLSTPPIAKVSRDAKSIHLCGNPVLLSIWGASIKHLRGGKTEEIPSSLEIWTKGSIAQATRNNTIRAWRHFRFLISTFDQDTKGGRSGYRYREVHVKFSQALTGYEIFDKRSHNGNSVMRVASRQ